MLNLLLTSLLLGSPTGGVFAGPTHANGSTIYWAPAVLGRLPPQTAVMAEFVGYVTHVTYQRAAEDPATQPGYPEVSFTSPTPDLSVTFLFNIDALESRGIRLYAGGFSPSGGGTRWPKDGPQRYGGTFGNYITYGAMGGLIWTPHPRVSFAAGGGPLYLNVKLENAYDFGAFINSKLTPGADLFALEDPALEGYLKLGMDGWTVMGQLSADVMVLDNLELAVGFFIAKTPTVDGNVEVQGPAALRDALPNLVVNPRGRILLPYPLPWFVSAEAKLTLGKWQIAPLLQFQRRSRQRVLVARVVESESDFIEGDQVSLRESRDEWVMGMRIARQLSDTLTLAVRGDVIPRNTPKEAINPVGLDFTLIEGNVGARILTGERTALELTASGVYGIPVNVERSIFNPRADPSSGLASSSPIGRYSALGAKIMIAFSARLGD
ncbi:MAG: hypothetical protein ACAI38_08335 [Myxococcota bacterium]